MNVRTIDICLISRVVVTDYVLRRERVTLNVTAVSLALNVYLLQCL